MNKEDKHGTFNMLLARSSTTSSLNKALTFKA